MWISRQFSKHQTQPTVQAGISTMNSEGRIEAVSTGTERDIKMYAPYGYSFSVPAGVEMLLSRCDGQQSAVGVLMNGAEVRCGEIMISAASGAYIYLKHNGSVVINGLEIDRNGVMHSEQIE